MLGHGDDHGLNGGHAGRQDQAPVVAVGHDDAADHAGGNAPAGLVGMVEDVVLAGKGDVKRLGKAVAEIVGGARLQRLAVVHHALHGIGLLGAVEFLLIGLLPLHHGHGQHVFHEVGIDVQHPLGLFPGLVGGGVHGVALLPQKLPVAQEGAGGLFPAQHAAPLVIQLGQIPVGMDDVLVMLAEQRFGGGADAQPVLQLLAAAHGDPGALGRKALHVILLLLEQGFGDQDGEIDVFVAGGLKAAIQLGLDVLPDGVAIGAIDEHALHRGIVDELGLGAHVGVPLGEVLVHGGDGGNGLFLVGHGISVLYYQNQWQEQDRPPQGTACRV